MATDSNTNVYQGTDIANMRTAVHTRAGFPSPAANRDTYAATLSLNQLLVRNPGSTFFFRLHGSGWEQQGIFDGDIAVIDRSMRPRSDDLIVMWHGENYSVSRYCDAPINITNFGVITSIIHEYRKGIA